MADIHLMKSHFEWLQVVHRRERLGGPVSLVGLVMAFGLCVREAPLF